MRIFKMFLPLAPFGCLNGGYDMSKNQKKRDMPEHQEWTPHWGLNLAYRIWMVIIGCITAMAGMREASASRIFTVMPA